MKKLFLAIFFLCIFIAGRTVAAERAAVKSDLANIRSGPATSYDVLWQVEKYYPIVIIEKSGNWVRFSDFESDQGWIHSSLISRIPTVITIKDNCNIRSGPGTDSKILFTVGKGIPFKIIKQKNSWLQIVHADGDQGWIHKSLVW